MTRHDYIARRTDPESSHGNHRWKDSSREQQIIATIERLDRQASDVRWRTADDITAEWNKMHPDDVRQRSHVSKTLSVLSAHGAVVRRTQPAAGSGKMLLHFRLPRVGEEVTPRKSKRPELRVLPNYVWCHFHAQVHVDQPNPYYEDTWDEGMNVDGSFNCSGAHVPLYIDRAKYGDDESFTDMRHISERTHHEGTLF